MENKGAPSIVVQDEKENVSGDVSAGELDFDGIDRAITRMQTEFLGKDGSPGRAGSRRGSTATSPLSSAQRTNLGPPVIPTMSTSRIFKYGSTLPTHVEDEFEDEPEAGEDPFTDANAQQRGQTPFTEYSAYTYNDAPASEYQAGGYMQPGDEGYEDDGGDYGDEYDDYEFGEDLGDYPQSYRTYSEDMQHNNHAQQEPQAGYAYPARYPNGGQAQAGSSVPPIRDHFQHDAEAYTSGVYSRVGGAQEQMRSRSATPMDGEEEYNRYSAASWEYVPSQVSQHAPNSAPGSYNGSYSGHSHYESEKGPSTTLPGMSTILSYALNPPPAGTTYPRTPEMESVSTHDEKSTIPDTPVTTQHFGPAPSGRVHRRYKIKKRIHLTNGNLVLDIPVPTKMVLARRGQETQMEMTRTRYTAVTCDPDDFEKSGFYLRQNEYNRRTEMFIVVTMYNEDEVLFCRTLQGVMTNIAHLCTRKNSQTWGQDAWKKVVVCIVADGRKKIHPRVLDCLTALGVFQPGGFMKNLVNNKSVTAHLFEYTTTFGLDEKIHFCYPPDKGVVPMQILFCLKEKNQKKINSHRWFFNAFAPLLQPNICILLDVGTRPGPKSLYYLWKTFDLNSNVGGACGEIAAYKGKHWKELINPLVAAQNFEYKISNILDKPTESLFGYISVLPGAFSAYRYIALQNNKKGQGPLASYFKGEQMHGRETDIYTSNMYLAEDRILCFELVAKANASWVLRYVKPAIGETDVPDALPEFISQRRRWLNGSFFAAVYAIAHTRQILGSGHSFSRKTALLLETLYNIINLVFSWFAIGNFYLFFVIVTSSLEDPSFGIPVVKYFNSIVQYGYASIVIAAFLFSMGNKPKASPWKYMTAAILFALLNVYMITCAVICAIAAARQGGYMYNTMMFSVIITYGVYAFSSFLAFDPWHLFTSFIPYLLLSPTYINILNIYAFSNLDDISWGTKQDTVVETDLGAVIQDSQSRVDLEIVAEPGDVNDMYDEALHNLKTRKPQHQPKTTFGLTEAEKEQAAKDYYANVRTNVLLLWVLTNGLLLLAILGGGSVSTTFDKDSGISRSKIYMTVILAFVGIANIIRFGGSTMYLLARIFTG